MPESTSSRTRYSPRADDVHLMYLPMSHAFGMKRSLMALATGGRLVLSDRFSSATALELIGRHRVTVLPATPTHLRLLFANEPVRYWGEPRLATGWYRTGDIGQTDDHGRLFVRGRLKELANCGGLKVPCAEVEAALRGVAAGADCAVISSPDPVLGEAICACVVPAAGAIPELGALRAALAGVPALHKLPEELCVMDETPHTSMGKVDRSALARRVVRTELPRERLRRKLPQSLRVAISRQGPRDK